MGTRGVGTLKLREGRPKSKVKMALNVDDDGGITREQFAHACDRLQDALDKISPRETWLRDTFLDHGWTNEFYGRVNGAPYAFSAHAWSWDGVVDEATIRQFIADHPEGKITLHLGDPVRPDPRIGE